MSTYADKEVYFASSVHICSSFNLDFHNILVIFISTYIFSKIFLLKKLTVRLVFIIQQNFCCTPHGKSSLCLSQGNLARDFLGKRVAFPMTGLPLFLGFLSSTLFVDFETRSSLAFLLASGLMKAQLVYLLRHIDILQTPSPLFGFDELKTRDVVSFSSLDVFVSSEQSYLKNTKEVLSKALY